MKALPSKFITMGDVIRAMDYLYDLPTQEQSQVAEQIMSIMEDSPHGFTNLGYLVGYYEPEKRKALYKILGLDNCYFGDSSGKE